MKEYEVGYKKPPVEHRIKKGFTKNYAGRPKTLAVAVQPAATLDTSSDAFVREAARKISVREGETVREFSVLEVMARTLSARATKGDIASTRLFVREVEKAHTRQTKRSEAAFAKGLEDKISHLVTLLLLEIDGHPTDNMPLHPDRIILRADGHVEVLPNLAAVEDRRARTSRRHELEAMTAELQKLVNQKQSKRDVGLLKSALAELRQLKKVKIVEEMPGIADAARRQAEQRVAAIRGSFIPRVTLTHAQMVEIAKARGLPTKIFDD